MNMMNQRIGLSENMAADIPEEEPQRQYYYIERAREYVSAQAERAGRPMTFCVTTFGCQMNFVPVTA